MNCNFVRVSDSLVRCLSCEQHLESSLPVDQIHVPCRSSRHAEQAASHSLSPPLRAVMITPGLQMGGAEIWVRTMIVEMDPRRIQWQSVLLAYPFTPIHENLIRPISERTIVYGPQAGPAQPEYPGLIKRFSSPQEASQAALAGADVVICWAVGRVLSELVAGFSGPVIAVSHGVCPWTKTDMKRQLDEGATHAVAVGSLAAAVCPDPASTRVILNGVNPERVRPQRSRDTVRTEWGVDRQNTVLVGYVGRFAPEKNATAAAAAVAQLPARFRAVLVGEAATPSFAEETRQLAMSLAGPRVRFVDATDEVGEIYAAIDVLVLASSAEGCSLTLIEAWLAGVPVVSTPVGIISEMEHRFGPMVFPVPLDPTAEELAHAVRDAAQGGRNSEIVQRARQVALGKLTAERMTETWASFLEEMTPRRHPAQPSSDQPQISIVVPAWNEATRIEKSLRSILAQTCQDFELIVVDDGSSDETAEVARSILSGRPWTQVIQKSNGGTGSALNQGFALARGNYLTWWSADSWVYPEWLERLKECLDAHPEIVMAYSDWENFDERNGTVQMRHVPEYDKARLLRQCYVGPCWLFRRSAKDIAGSYLEEPCEDYDMHLKLAEVGPFRRVPQVLGVWRNHPLNVSNRLVLNPQPTRWQGQAERIQERHRQRTQPEQ